MTETVFGAFGKIPSVGDFFQMSAPAGFVQVWDEWLQQCLVSGAQTFGQRWDELYMSGPIWRFCLSANLAGPKKVLGVLMPSVDRVGRRFPLTLMVPLSDEPSVLLDHLVNEDVFASLEDTALAMLEDDATRDGLEAALSTAPECHAPTHVTCSTKGSSLVLQHAGDPASTSAIVASSCLADNYSAPSVWSTVMEGDTRLMVCNGLPQGPNMQGLFDLDAAVWKESTV